MSIKRKPHIHAELIKAWADGAIIEVEDGGRWYEMPAPDRFTEWSPNFVYRIQPEKKSAGQIAFEAWHTSRGFPEYNWINSSFDNKKAWEAAAQAVLAASKDGSIIA